MITMNKIKKLVEKNTIIHCATNDAIYDVLFVGDKLEFCLEDDIFTPQNVKIKDIKIVSECYSEVKAFLNGTLKEYRAERKERRKEYRKESFYEAFGGHTPLFVPYEELLEDEEDEYDIF